MSVVRVGCSGFNYTHWKETFYPKGLPQRKWLVYYCTVFPAVELNVTFYRLPKESSFDKWYKETPSHFTFSLKGSRYITHVKRLSEPEESVALFFRGALRLKKKLRTVLWQFPPSFRIHIERLAQFLKLLRKYPVRNTLEFRHESWIHDTVFDVCRENNVSLCLADSPGFLNDLPIVSDFVYIRRHGKEGRYDSCYTKAELRKDRDRIRGFLRNRRNVFIYFNNDAFGYAPKNAQELMGMLTSA